ncbi:hypothetical protein BDV18DRAFT_130823 [Aspergillus unguis]
MIAKIAKLSGLALLASQVVSQRIVVPAQTPSGEDSHVQWISGPSGFDAPKNRPQNTTSYDWWYFDTVSEPDARGEQPSFVATFYNTGPDGFDPLRSLFPNGSYPSSNFVQLDLTWPNGTIENWFLIAGEAVITVEGDGASGNFSNTGCSFEATPDMSQYVITVNAPQKGIVGSMSIISDAPAHYPCGPNEEGQNMQLVPTAGWLNAIPDGLGEVQFNIRGHQMSYQGRGYHDHNYGNQPFSQAFMATYWGHGRIGEYAIVWADTLVPNGDNYVSAYVARDGEIVTAQCEGIQVRPYGDNSTYPPTTSSGTPTGVRMEIDSADGQFELEAEYITITVDSNYYRRFTGTFRGTLDGQELPDGVALWEQFTFAE